MRAGAGGATTCAEGAPRAPSLARRVGVTPSAARDLLASRRGPPQLRAAGNLARLGHPERAHAMLDLFMRDQRAAGWKHRAEVVRRDRKLPAEVEFRY